MIWRVGMKAECVDDRSSVTPCVSGAPEVFEGEIFTVREIIFGQDAIYLRFVEIPGPHGWFAWRFRPVVDHPTSIEIFTKILDRENLRQKVPASVE